MKGFRGEEKEAMDEREMEKRGERRDRQVCKFAIEHSFECLPHAHVNL